MVEESRFRYRRDDGMAGGGSATDARYAPRLTAQRAPAPDVRGIDRADGMSRGTAPGGFSGRLEASRSAPAPDYDRDYSRAPEPARDAGRPAASKDTLAELARLIGDQDPFAEFSDLERKAANAPVSEDDYDDDYADDDRRHDDEDDDDGEDDRRWDDRAPARADAYGRAPAPTAAPAARAAPQAPAYGPFRSAGTAAAADYGDDPYDDDDRYDDEDDAYDAPAPVAPRQAQLPAPRAAAAPASPAVRTGYGSLARQVPAPSAPANAAGRAAPSSYDDGYDDDDDYDRSRGYDDDEDDGYASAPPATSAPARAVDPRSVDPRGAAGRTFDARAADPRAPQAASRSAALPAPVPARADARRAPDAPAYGVKPQPAPAPARQAPQAASQVPQAPAYDDDYDDGYDDDGYGAKPADPRGYSAPAAARGRGGYDRSDARGSGEAAYAYSAERRDDGYDDYDDAYDPQFADAGYMPPHGEDVYETEPRRKKGRMALLMVASLLGLGVAGAAGFFAYRMAVGEATFGSATPSVIRADNAPVKTVAPPATDPQGKLITERLGAGGSANERLVTREETPVEVTAATRVATNGTPQGEPKRVKTYAVRPDGTMATPAPGTPPANGSVSAFAPTQAPLTSGVASVAAPAQTAALTPPVAAGGSYVVQVASQRSEADAQGSWKALQAKYPTLLGSYSAQVRKADLGERGVFYRAQVGPFASRDQANELCQALRGQGGDCIVNKN